MQTPQTFVIVGAGLAGAKTAEALREQGYAGRIVLVGAEAHRPYERPPLSKGYLSGSSERDGVFVHAPEWYDEHDVELRLGVTATAIDRSERQVVLDDGSRLAYDKLLLTTGARPRRLPMVGADADGVLHLRDLDDSDRLRTTLEQATSLVVIGAGWIGLEVAAAARAAGVAVTVVEAAELPLLRVLGTEVAQVFADLHRDHGVDFRFGATLTSIHTEANRVRSVELADGAVLDADAVLVAVGIAPNTELAEAAGLTVDNGVLVDAALRTSDPDVLAAGDVANAAHPFYGTPIRVEHWANAINQPAIAAATMLGKDAAYEALPYFFTDQYDLGMEYVGYIGADGYDQVVFRGDVAKREFIAFWLRDRRVLAGMNVNVWDVTDQIKQLIGSRLPVDPAGLADPATPLGTLVAA
jgi:3-phenylpropionate/trans-cinnamate dioxygenase ferredoxin reductase component